MEFIMKIFTTNGLGVLGRWTHLSLILQGFLGVLLTTALLVPSIVLSQWSGNPKVNNLISNAANDQVNAASVSDGAGGAIIVWQDKRGGSTYDIYAQRVNASGAVQWTANGLAICAADSDQVSPAIISDGSGGAIIAWQDKRSDSYDIYAQRVNASGVLQWTPATGDSVCKAVFDQVNIAMVSDGSGGALLTWEDYRSNAGPGLADVYAQKLNATGVPQWTANGIGVCTQGAAQHGPRIISDGAGGAILTWYDQRAGNYDIYAQRVTAAGGLTGIAGGVAVCTSATDQTNPDMCSDGNGGAIIVWQDFRSTTSIDIWVQRMSPALAIRWPVDGVVMNNNVAYDQINPKIVSDGVGGAMMAWEDFRTGITSDIYAQRVDSTGVVATGWNVNGVTVCVSENNQSNLKIIADTSHGAIITWMDKRDSSTNHNTYDIYASRITGDFALPWTANGVPVCTADSTQTNPAIAGDGSGGAIITWQDKRSGNYDIYASRVFPNGTLSTVESAGIAPAGFMLSQNYPNPFNPTTVISYQLSVNGYVTLKVYDVLGSEVAVLVNGRQEAGSYTVPFNTNNGTLNLSSGVYFYRLEAGAFVSTKKLILMK
jgi:beta propeller repeat protein